MSTNNSKPVVVTSGKTGGGMASSYYNIVK
jgi:hypothetical protein